MTTQSLGIAVFSIVAALVCDAQAAIQPISRTSHVVASIPEYGPTPGSRDENTEAFGAEIGRCSSTAYTEQLGWTKATATAIATTDIFADHLKIDVACSTYSQAPSQPGGVIDATLTFDITTPTTFLCSFQLRGWVRADLWLNRMDGECVVYRGEMDTFSLPPIHTPQYWDWSETLAPGTYDISVHLTNTQHMHMAPGGSLIFSMQAVPEPTGCFVLPLACLVLRRRH